MSGINGITSRLVAKLVGTAGGGDTISIPGRSSGGGFAASVSVAGKRLSETGALNIASLASSLNTTEDALGEILNFAEKAQKILKAVVDSPTSSNKISKANTELRKLGKEVSKSLQRIEVGSLDLSNKDDLTALFEGVGLKQETASSIADTFKKLVVDKSGDPIIADPGIKPDKFKIPSKLTSVGVPGTPEQIIDTRQQSTAKDADFRMNGTGAAIGTNTSVSPGSVDPYNPDFDGIVSLNSSTTVTEKSIVETLGSDVALLAFDEINGRALIVSSDDLQSGQNPSGRRNLFLVDASGKVLQQYTDIADDEVIAAADFSDDGLTVVAAISQGSAVEIRRLTVSSLETTQASVSSTLIATKTTGDVTRVEVSNDGTRAVFDDAGTLNGVSLSGTPSIGSFTPAYDQTADGGGFGFVGNDVVYYSGNQILKQSDGFTTTNTTTIVNSIDLDTTGSFTASGSHLAVETAGGSIEVYDASGNQIFSYSIGAGNSVDRLGLTTTVDGDWPVVSVEGKLNSDSGLNLYRLEYDGTTATATKVVDDLAITTPGIFGAGTLRNQGTFAIDQTTPFATTFYGTQTGDIDQDGNLDLIFAGRNGGEGIYIAYGNGDGTFGTPLTLSTSTSNDSVIVADLDNDGNLDIVADNGSAEQIDVFLGNGDGTFAAPTTASSFANGFAGGGGSYVATDYDGDGYLDLVGAVSGTAIYKVHLNNGTGTFANAVTYSTGGTQLSGTRDAVAFGDFDEDGKQDAIFASFTVGSGLLLGNGDGTFGAYTDLETVGTQSHIEAGDFDGDGNLDYVTTSLSSSDVYFYRGNGNGTFEAATTLGVSINATEVRSADFNGDGTLDLIIGESDGVEVFLGNGNGTFKAGLKNTDEFLGHFALGDFDEDGFLDIGGNTHFGTDATVFLQNQTNTGVNGGVTKHLNLFVGDDASFANNNPGDLSVNFVTDATKITSLLNSGEITHSVTLKAVSESGNFYVFESKGDYADFNTNQSNGSNRDQLYLVEIVNGAHIIRQQVTNSSNTDVNFEAAVANDGTVTYISDDSGVTDVKVVELGSFGVNLAAVDAATTTIQSGSGTLSFSSTAISSDGTKIAYRTSDSGTTTIELYDTNSSGLDAFLSGETDVNLGGPSFSGNTLILNHDSGTTTDFVGYTFASASYSAPILADSGVNGLISVTDPNSNQAGDPGLLTVFNPTASTHGSFFVYDIDTGEELLEYQVAEAADAVDVAHAKFDSNGDITLSFSGMINTGTQPDQGTFTVTQTGSLTVIPEVPASLQNFPNKLKSNSIADIFKVQIRSRADAYVAMKHVEALVKQLKENVDQVGELREAVGQTYQLVRTAGLTFLRAAENEAITAESLAQELKKTIGANKNIALGAHGKVDVETLQDILQAALAAAASE